MKEGSDILFLQKLVVILGSPAMDTRVPTEHGCVELCGRGLGPVWVGRVFVTVEMVSSIF